MKRKSNKKKIKKFLVFFFIFLKFATMKDKSIILVSKLFLNIKKRDTFVD